MYIISCFAVGSLLDAMTEYSLARSLSVSSSRQVLGYFWAEVSCIGRAGCRAPVCIDPLQPDYLHTCSYGTWWTFTL